MSNSDEDEVLRHLSNIQPRKEDKGAFWIGVVFVLIAIAVPAYQTYVWLKAGIWHPKPMSILFGQLASTGWVGVDKILAWLIDLPLWTIPAFMAFGAFSAWKETA